MGRAVARGDRKISGYEGQRDKDRADGHMQVEVDRDENRLKDSGQREQ